MNTNTKAGELPATALADDDSPTEALHEREADGLVGFGGTGAGAHGGASGVHEGRGVRHAADEAHGVRVAPEQGGDALQSKAGGNGDDERVGTHRVANLVDDLAEELRLHG